jgi:hypothetical protein
MTASMDSGSSVGNTSSASPDPADFKDSVLGILIPTYAGMYYNTLSNEQSTSFPLQRRLQPCKCGPEAMVELSKNPLCRGVFGRGAIA